MLSRTPQPPAPYGRGGIVARGQCPWEMALGNDGGIWGAAGYCCCGGVGHFHRLCLGNAASPSAACGEIGWGVLQFAYIIISAVMWANEAALLSHPLPLVGVESSRGGSAPGRWISAMMGGFGARLVTVVAEVSGTPIGVASEVPLRPPPPAASAAGILVQLIKVKPRSSATRSLRAGWIRRTGAVPLGGIRGGMGGIGVQMGMFSPHSSATRSPRSGWNRRTGAVPLFDNIRCEMGPIGR